MKLRWRAGVKMSVFISEHEEYAERQYSALGDSEGLRALLEHHDRKLGWLQHERLTHLIVTVLSVVLFIFFFAMQVYVRADALGLALTAVFLCLTVAYLYHYLLLENSTQRWYLLSDRIRERLRVAGEAEKQPAEYDPA